MSHHPELKNRKNYKLPSGKLNLIAASDVL